MARFFLLPWAWRDHAYGLSGGVLCYPVEVLHLADLLTLERLGEARAVWGLVVETLLCGVSLAWMKVGSFPGLPDLYSIPCRAVLV
jgi:hypothetical protein